MSRTFDQVLANVTAQSDPQRKVILNQIADLPNQQTAAEQGLAAQKDQAYQDILSGARQRGLGFSGIPLAEQAKYNATNYAPAVANLKSTYANQQGSLENALANIGSSNYATANDVFNQDRNYAFQQQQAAQQAALQQQQLAEQQRQFNENLALQKQQAASQGASNSALASLFQQPQTPLQSQPKQNQPTEQQQTDYNFVRSLINQVQRGDGSTWSLIFGQAKSGDQRSKDILRAYYQLQNKAAPATISRYL